MRIGILTFQFADNYGALLQAYALREKIKLLGYKVDIINYINPHLKQAYSINPFKRVGIVNKIKAFLKYPISRIQHNKFALFREQRLSLGEPIESILGYDKVIVGSDQVWNLDITRNDFTYFFEGVYSKEYYSYAASSKDDFLCVEYRERLVRLLSKFKIITVREKTLLSDLKELGIQGDVVLDPVLLHDRNFWKVLEKRPKYLPEKYILFYALSENPKLEKVAEQLSKEKNLPIIVVHPMARRITKIGKLRYDVGAEEFVYLINHAECIVSNSFHAFAFSAIFKKRIFFDFIPGLSSRVSNLCEMLDMKKNIDDYCGIKSVQVDLQTNCNYTNALEKSNAFLKKILND